MDCLGQRLVGYRLENGEPFVVTWHVANVTKLIISTEPLTGANIEVIHAKNESSMIMDRTSTRTSVVLYKFAKVPWLKLRRDNSFLDNVKGINPAPHIHEHLRYTIMATALRTPSRITTSCLSTLR